jgi:phytanoyl-CoA hydroxylase
MSDATEALSPEEAAVPFHRDGYVVLRGFASRSECEGMLSRMAALIDEWEPMAANEKLSVFRTDSEQEGAQGADDYFLSSADKVRFFLEPGAADEATGALRPGVQKATALNKVGHALHELVPEFREYSHSTKVQKLVTALGLRSPDLVQSMYIFKQPRIGALVTPHQDSCFLRTNPLSCVGLWLALERADETNGCLWARPGSHVEPLRRHFARETPVSHNAGGRPGEGKMSFVWMPGSEGVEASKWEGGLPAGVAGPADLGFVPVVAEAGDLVVIHGQVRSAPHQPTAFRTFKPCKAMKIAFAKCGCALSRTPRCNRTLLTPRPWLRSRRGRGGGSPCHPWAGGRGQHL